jgi:hypothetical protein
VPIGYCEFSFYIDPDTEPKGECRAVFRFGNQRPLEFQVGLIGTERWYEVGLPNKNFKQRQNIARTPGWHTLGIKWQADSLLLTIDGFQLADGRTTAPDQPSLSAVEISSSLTTGAVWIDDLALVEPAPTAHSAIVQRKTDQLSLVSGDQLFGEVTRIDNQSMLFAVNSQIDPIQWSDIAELRFENRPAALERRPGSCRRRLYPRRAHQR